MVGQIPPEGVAVVPNFRRLPPGTVLWRCHTTDRGPAEFNTRRAHIMFGGGRFDGTDMDPYHYLYAALEPATALAEVFLRSLEFSGPKGERLVPWASARLHALSPVRTGDELNLVSLVTEEDLAAVSQTAWLLEAEETQFAKTRYWAKTLREQVPDAQGFIWQSHRHRPRECVVLFGDRCEGAAFTPEPDGSFVLSTPEGRAEANRLIAPLRAQIMAPESEAEE